MKNLIYLFISVFLFTTFLSCEHDLPANADFDAYNYQSIDENGGNWKPIILTSNEDVVIPAPTDVNSAEYKAELSEMIAAQKTKTDNDVSAINYWGNNPAIRWNEITCDLTTKYNLIPAPNPDGTYPGPNAANPGKYPLFPYTHPPYSSRVFANLSGAWFDGLISAWHYKYKFNRPAIHKSNTEVQQLLPTSELPSYPSDAAVINAISRVILTAMFPLEKDDLIKKSDELKNSLFLSGNAVKSDIEAADSLGRGIAKIYLARAAGDGMKSAQTPKPISDSIKNAAFQRFGWSWTNQEIPERPVGLTPLYGKVKTWFVPDVVAIRPPVPPAPGSEEFKKHEAEMKSISENMTTKQRAIANFWNDGLNTYTPPGHWNRFATNDIVKYKLNPLRTVRILAYLNMAMMDAGICCWDAKFYYHYPRPVQAISGFQTILGTPNFPSYTSGHSTFSAAAAEVLSFFIPQNTTTYNQYASEASDSRIYGGIHYRFDCQAGLVQGKKIGEITVNVARNDGAQ